MEATVEKYKASMDFVVDMAHIVASFWASKEFSNAGVAFSHEAFMKGHELGMVKCRSQVTKYHQGLDLSFLDIGEFKGKPSNEATTPSTPLRLC